jgi:hypothetical protein
MAIDDPKDAFEKYYLEEKPTLPLALAKAAARLGGLAVPGGALAAEILGKIADTLFDTCPRRSVLRRCGPGSSRR